MGLRGVSAIFRLAGSGNREQRAEGEYLHVRDCQGWRHHVWRGEESPAHQGSLGITEEGPDYNNRCCRRQRSRYRFYLKGSRANIWVFNNHGDTAGGGDEVMTTPDY